MDPYFRLDYDRRGCFRYPRGNRLAVVAGPPTKAQQRIGGLLNMPNDGASLSKGKPRDAAAPTSGDAGKKPPESRRPRRRPVSERIIEEISVERRVALEILADR